MKNSVKVLRVDVTFDATDERNARRWARDRRYNFDNLSDLMSQFLVSGESRNYGSAAFDIAEASIAPCDD